MLRSFAVASLVAVSAVAAAPAGAVSLDDVAVKSLADRVEVVLSSSDPLTFQAFGRSLPPALVIDLLDTEGQARTFTPPSTGLVNDIAVSRHDGKGTPLTRVTIGLSRVVEHDVTARGNQIIVTLFKKSVALDVSGSVVDNKAPKLAMRGDARGIVDGSLGRSTSPVELAQAEGQRQMTYIGFKNSDTQSRVYARLNGAAEYVVKKEGENLIVLEIRNTTIPLRNNKNHLDTQFFNSPVKMITPSEVEDATPTVRIAIEMETLVPYEAKVEGKDIVVTFKK